MTGLAEKFKKTKPVHWFTLRECKIGVYKLTPKQMREYAAKIEKIEDNMELTRHFAPFVIDENYDQAFTAEEYDEIVTNSELQTILREFNKAR